jgi:SAM-dependent methyltransferase
LTAGIIDRIGILPKAWASAWRLPGKYKLPFLLNPVDATRYMEFTCLLRLIRQDGFKAARVLDISSPLILSYILAADGSQVCKTDIDPGQGRYFRNGGPVKFKREDATCLTFSDDSFDLVYSISVIEHIHEHYEQAISEMVRVTRPGGLVYITFPVAGQTVEEWMDFPIYPDQAVKDDKTFFQYRFGPGQVANIIENLPKTVDVVGQDIFWERWEGLYDWLVGQLHRSGNSRVFGRLKSAALNLVLGPIFFEEAPGTFEKCKSFGNAHIAMKKKGAGCGSIWE